MDFRIKENKSAVGYIYTGKWVLSNKYPHHIHVAFKKKNILAARIFHFFNKFESVEDFFRNFNKLLFLIIYFI